MSYSMTPPPLDPMPVDFEDPEEPHPPHLDSEEPQSTSSSASTRPNEASLSLPDEPSLPDPAFSTSSSAASSARPEPEPEAQPPEPTSADSEADQTGQGESEESRSCEEELPESAAPAEPLPAAEAEPTPPDSAETDEFGDFEEFAAFEGGSGGDGSEEWAAFAETPSEGAASTAAADWATASAAQATPAPLQTPPAPSLASLEELVRSKAWLDSLPEAFSSAGEEGTEAEREEDEGDSGLLSCLGQARGWWDSPPAETSAAEAMESDQTSSVRLWRRLRRVEESAALGTGWGISAAAYTAFLAALRLSHELAQMRLGDPKRPAFARQLDVVKITPTPLLQPSTASAVSAPTTTGGIESPAKEKSPPPPVPSSLAVPPVDFSWTDSGLTNPLHNPAAPSNGPLPGDMDLSALEAKAGRGKESGNALQAELARMGLADPDPSKSAPAKVSSGGLASLSVAGLSAEAEALAARLPDLSFLLKDYLSFPVAQTSSASPSPATPSHSNDPNRI